MLLHETWIRYDIYTFMHSKTQELEYLFFLSRKVRNFFPEFNIRLYDKKIWIRLFFFPPPQSEYFFQQHWESKYFFRKIKTVTHPFKLNGDSLRCHTSLQLYIAVILWYQGWIVFSSNFTDFSYFSLLKKFRKL